MFSADICVVHFTNDHKTLCLQLSFKRRAISTIFVVPWKSVETILLNNYFRSCVGTGEWVGPFHF